MSSGRHAVADPSGSWVAAYWVGIAYVVVSAVYFSLRLAW
jgi:hypothetical protein